METPRPLPYKPFLFTDLEGMLAEPPAPAWLIRGYLEADSLAVLYGASGVMKTFVALDMAFCIASGLPWHGIPTHNPGPSFYIAGEGKRGISKRLKALTIKHGVNAGDLHFFTSNEPAQLLDPNSRDALIEAVFELAEKHGTPRLVVIDTLNRCFGPGDENRTADMTLFIAALDKIRTEFECAVLVIHHTGNKKTERARGSSALRGSIDVELCIFAAGEQRVLSCTKVKDHEAPPDIYFKPETVSTGWLDPETGEEITSCVLNRGARVAKRSRPLPEAVDVAYRALKKVCSQTETAHIDEWRRESYNMGIAKAGTPAANQQALNRAMKRLLKDGYVTEEEKNFYRLARRVETDHANGQTNGHDNDNAHTCRAQHDETDKTPPL